ncbi:hypothetical protein [Haloactinomyces albus]
MLILLVLGMVGMGAVAVSWWPLPSVLGDGGAAAELRPATATVLESASCAASTKGDLVEVRIGGQRMRVRYDGCGHRPGQRLSVRVPVAASGGVVDRPFVARPAAPAEAGGAEVSSLRERLSWVLLTLAGVAGSGYALLLRWMRAESLDRS